MFDPYVQSKNRNYHCIPKVNRNLDNAITIYAQRFPGSSKGRVTLKKKIYRITRSLVGKEINFMYYEMLKPMEG